MTYQFLPADGHVSGATDQDYGQKPPFMARGREWLLGVFKDSEFVLGLVPPPTRLFGNLRIGYRDLLGPPSSVR
jgi:hypothetical protein